MRIYDGNDYRDMTTEEIAAWEQAMSNTPAPEPTPEERITALEEAFGLILSGAIELGIKE